MGKSRYYNRKVTLFNIVFDSQGEGERYLKLLDRQERGEIKNLTVQPRFVLQPSFKRGKKTIRKIEYIADFQYDENGVTVVEDYKGKAKKGKNGKKARTTETPEFRLKAKILQFKFPEIDFRVVTDEAA